MDWRDQGSLLSVRRHGENAAIIEVFTQHHGRHAGVVRGGASRRLAPILQPGAQLDVEWRARLEEHLGTFRVEPLRARAALMMDDRLALTGLNAICGLLKFALPEREAHPRLYRETEAMLDLLTTGEGWLGSYVSWELVLLADLGFGLDLEACAVTGAQVDLAFVSPKSGSAVSCAGAGEWADRLLAFPHPDRVADSLVTTGYFLENWLAPSLGERRLPDARQRLIDRITRQRR